ncbi:hypothetical protein ACN3XK_54930 [Actinomadura welshii]
MTARYFDDLAGRLRAGGVPEAEVAGTIDDLAAYVAESGTDPRDEFGTPEEFAGTLIGPADGGSPEPSAETWRWTADAFQDRTMLDRFGDEGWEVERVDSVGRFVCRRDAENPQRWEYRRETVLPGRRQAVAERLAPDGWERCGTWMYFEYFKRPKAASVGPGADLQAPPGPPARKYFWSRRFYVFMAGYIAFVAAVCAAGYVLLPADDRTGFLTGAAAGGALAAAGLAVGAWRSRRRDTAD